MQEVLENKLREIYNSLVIKPKEVYDIFCHHFGENRVDIIETTNTGTSVYIWFPKETISNSKGQKHTIYDLYIKINFVYFKHH